MIMTPDEAAETLVCGNVTDFKEWAKRCTKAQLLDVILSYSEMSGATPYDALHYIYRLIR